MMSFGATCCSKSASVTIGLFVSWMSGSCGRSTINQISLGIDQDGTAQQEIPFASSFVMRLRSFLIGVGPAAIGPHCNISRAPRRKLRQSELLCLIDDGTLKFLFGPFLFHPSFRAKRHTSEWSRRSHDSCSSQHSWARCDDASACSNRRTCVVASLSLCTATQVVHAKASNESTDLVAASASRQDCRWRRASRVRTVASLISAGTVEVVRWNCQLSLCTLFQSDPTQQFPKWCLRVWSSISPLL